MVEPKKMVELTDTESEPNEVVKSVHDIFMQSIARPSPNTKNSDTDSDKQLFKFEDVLMTSHPLARLLRCVLADHHITNVEFEDKHRDYAEEAGYLSAQIGYSRNNIKKGMNKSRITWPMFETIALVILGFTLEDVEIKLRHPSTGEIHTYSLQGIVDKAKELYGDATPVIETQGDSICMPIKSPIAE